MREGGGTPLSHYPSGSVRPVSFLDMLGLSIFSPIYGHLVLFHPARWFSIIVPLADAMNLDQGLWLFSIGTAPVDCLPDLASFKVSIHVPQGSLTPLRPSFHSVHTKPFSCQVKNEISFPFITLFPRV